MHDRLEGVKVSRTILEGQPAEAIVKHCGEQHADLLVLPTRGRNPLRHFILGPVTSKVLHESRCSVSTGVHLERSFEFPRFQVRRVLCAVDLGPRSETVIRREGEFARVFGADLTTIRIAAGGTTAEPPQPGFRACDSRCSGSVWRGAQGGLRYRRSGPRRSRGHRASRGRRPATAACKPVRDHPRITLSRYQ